MSVAVSVALGAVLMLRVAPATVMLLVVLAAAAAAVLAPLVSRAAVALQAHAVLDVVLAIYHATWLCGPRVVDGAACACG
eukprot:12194510-Alexandrium_andersonii.AAC.1